MRGPNLSLAGKRVWVTRPARQAAGLCGLIAARQGVAVKMPTLAILPAREELSLPARARRLRESDIVVFISRNAVVHAHDLFPQLDAMLRGKTVWRRRPGHRRNIGEPGGGWRAQGRGWRR